MTQLGLLRHPVLQWGLLRDRGVAGETSEVDRRWIRRTFYTEAHHVRVPVLPLAALPHHVHPWGLRRDPGFLNQGQCDAITSAYPLRIYLSSGVRQGTCSTKLLTGEYERYIILLTYRGLTVCHAACIKIILLCHFLKLKIHIIIYFGNVIPLLHELHYTNNKLN